jgi:hypothetical protein
MQRTSSSTLSRLCISAGLAVGLALAGQLAFLPSADATTVLTVSTTADVSAGTGACGNAGITTAPSPLSLREATCLADNLGGDVTISVPAGIYNLTSGELRLGAGPGQTITLAGAGPASTVIDAGGLNRVLELDYNLTGGISSTISGLTLRGGSDATYGGGGIIAGSGTSTSLDSLTISNSAITGNQTDAGGSGALPGGGVQFIGGSLSIVNSTISGNSSGASPGSGLFYQGIVGGDQLSVTGSTISGNSADASGAVNGGALALVGASYDITGTRFVSNTVTGGSARGAAIWSESGALTVTGSSFTGNTAATGGAVAVDGDSAALHYNRFTGNTAPTGSAVSSAVGAGVDATENWWGCNTGPATTGCGTVSGGPTVSPRLVLTASASPALVTGPNATSTITATLTQDSLGATVDPAQLGGFDGLPMSWTDPQPTGATVSAPSSNLSAGSATTTYDSNAASGAGHVLATLDNGTATASITIANQPPAFTSTDHSSFVVSSAGSFSITTTGFPTATLSRAGAQFPAWLALTDNGNGTGTLTGTPPAGSADSYQFTLTATNSAGSASQAFTLYVDDSPGITSADHTTLTAGQAGSFAVTTVAGYPTTTAITESGALPSGVTLHDNGDGTATLAGTPAAGTGGTCSITITATAVGGLAAPATQSFTLTVLEPPAITSTNHATFAVGAAGSFTVTTHAGFPTATMLTKAGALPSGVSFTDNGDGTAALTGTPTAGSQGVYPITITGSNGVAPDATQTFTLTVNAAPTITSAGHATFTVNATATFTVTTGGQPTPSLSETGSLPPGMTFTDNGDGTATLGGTPTSGGSYSFTITASNGVLPNATQAFTATVNAPPSITSSNFTTFTVGSAGSFTVTTTPGIPTATTITESGSLPSGVVFTDNGNGTATLAGTPAAGTGGSYVLTFTASNGVQPNATQMFGLTVNEPPSITSADHTTFQVGSAGNFTVTTTAGFPTYTSLTEVGSLPTGITFTDNGNGTATLTGTPAAGSEGSYPLTVSASNSVGRTDQAFTLTVSGSPVITSADHTSFIVGSAGSFTVTTAPTATSITKSGTLPSGVTFTDNGNGTATLAGTPAAGTGGSYPITITASNGTPPNATQAFTLTVGASPTITSANNTTFMELQAGTFTVTTSGGFPTPPGLSETGSLPTGVTFHDNGNGTATLAGTASDSGTFALTIMANNGVAPAASQSFTLTVKLPLTAIDPGRQTGIVGVAKSVTMTAVGGTTPYTWSATGLPPGKTINASTGVISGAPTTGGVYTSTVTVKDATKATSSVSFNWVIGTPGSVTVTNPGNQTGFVGNSVSLTMQASGGYIPYTWSATGLPPGLTVDSNYWIDGYPWVAGTYHVRLTATDDTGVTGSASFTWVVNTGPFTVANPGNQTGAVGTHEYVNESASGGKGPYTWSATGVPSGLTLHTDTGTIGGTPTTAGTYSVTVTATDAANATGSVTFSWYISPMQIADPGTQRWEIGVPVSLQMQLLVNGSPPYAWSANNLQQGVTISATTGLISGTPTDRNPKASTTVSVTDSTGAKATLTLTKGIASAVQLSNYVGSGTLAVGQSYQLQMRATYGYTPYTFSATNLPPGFSISNDGLISGAGTTPGTYAVTVVVSDALGATDSSSGTWTITS